MKRYEIMKERQIEMRYTGRCTVTDLERFADNRYGEWFESIAHFDTMEEAQERFEAEKANCTTRYVRTMVFPVVEFDYIKLVETEWDEDQEEWVWDCDAWDWYISDFDNDDNNEDNEETED